MAYDEGLATRVREVLGDQPGLVEKQMFGGLAFLVQGNMACGVRGEDLIMRVAADAAEVASGEPGVRPFDLTGRPMKGWLLVAADGTATPRTRTCGAGSTGAWPTLPPCRPGSRVSGPASKVRRRGWRATGRWSVSSPGAGAPAVHDARRAPLGLGLDRGQRGRHRLLPAARHQRTPALPRPPQVGADLAAVGQPRAGPTGLLGQHERSTTWGTGPRTRRKSTRSGRVNRTVSTVWRPAPAAHPGG